jgi:hypothetical protein
MLWAWHSRSASQAVGLRQRPFSTASKHGAGSDSDHRSSDRRAHLALHPDRAEVAAMSVTLMLGDCLQRMKEIPDGSIEERGEVGSRHR